MAQIWTNTKLPSKRNTNNKTDTLGWLLLTTVILEIVGYDCEVNCSKTNEYILNRKRKETSHRISVS